MKSDFVDNRSAWSELVSSSIAAYLKLVRLLAKFPLSMTHYLQTTVLYKGMQLESVCTSMCASHISPALIDYMKVPIKAVSQRLIN